MTVTFDRILCPVDFSEPSRHAAEHAMTIAKWYGAAVTALHVQTATYHPTSGLDVPDCPDQTGIVTEQRLRAELADWFKPAADSGIGLEILIEQGSPVSRIIERIFTHSADLVVVGTHGAAGFERLVLGSVTEKVLRKAGCPVLTVPPRAQATSRLPFKRLLCPIDFSTPSREALRFALSMAKESDADLTILHVVEWPPEVEPRLPELNLTAYRVYREKGAAAEMAGLVPAEAREWCRPATEVVHGKPYEQILNAAADHHADLIVIGVHGRNPVDLMLFGSTTNQLIRRATCPVLTIRR